jgi:hypothetical protein
MRIVFRDVRLGRSTSRVNRTLAPPGLFRPDAQAPTMVRTMEAHAQSVFLAGVKRLKNVASLSAGMPVCVAHRNLDRGRASLVSIRSSRRLTGPAHRIHGVEDEVEQHLLQVDSVCSHTGQAVAQVQPQHHLPHAQIRFDERYDLAHQRVDGNWLDSDLPFSKEGAQPLNDVRGAAIVPDNVRKDLPHLVQRRWISVKEKLAGLSVAQDGTLGMV